MLPFSAFFVFPWRSLPVIIAARLAERAFLYEFDCIIPVFSLAFYCQLMYDKQAAYDRRAPCDAAV